MRRAKGDERDLWHRATRDVQPLRRATDMPETLNEKQPPLEPSRGSSLPRARGTVRVVAASNPPARLDRRTAQRLKRGQTPIEARLDLHGMTQVEAHEALARFIARSHASGLRAVIVITGKSGVLRSAVPRWLEEGENRARIVGSSRAQAQHGGEGALYVLLRRQR
jgi:DNA-nicking Smr family endonuclease